VGGGEGEGRFGGGEAQRGKKRSRTLELKKQRSWKFRVGGIKGPIVERKLLGESKVGGGGGRLMVGMWKVSGKKKKTTKKKKKKKKKGKRGGKLKGASVVDLTRSQEKDNFKRNPPTVRGKKPFLKHFKPSLNIGGRGFIKGGGGGKKGGRIGGFNHRGQTLQTESWELSRKSLVGTSIRELRRKYWPDGGEVLRK